MHDFINKQGVERDFTKPLIKGSPEWDNYFPKKKKKDTSNRYEEFALQKGCVSWFRKQYPYLWRCLYMVKNDGLKNRVQNEKTGIWFSPQANRDNVQGLVPGVSDLYFMLPNKDYTSWSIECKTSIGSQSQDQISHEFISIAAGKKYTIIRKTDEFIYEMTAYMSTVPIKIIEDIKKIEDSYNRILSERAAKRIIK